LFLSQKSLTLKKEGTTTTMTDRAILRVTKHKTEDTIRHAVAHQLREIPTENADPKRRNLNRDSVKSSVEVLEEFERRAVGVKRNKREKDKRGRDQRSVIALEYLMAVPPSADWKRDGERVSAWAKASLAFVEEKHGKGAVLSYHLQLDEQTPHLAVFVDTIKNTPKGRVFDAKRYTDGGKKLSQLQTAYASKMAPFGLSRGVEGSTATHQETKRYRARLKKGKQKPPSRLDLLGMGDADRLDYLRTLEAKEAEARAEVERLAKVNEKQAAKIAGLHRSLDGLKEDAALMLKAGARLLKSAFTREEFEKALGVEIKGKQDVFDAVLKSGKYTDKATTFAHAFALVAAVMPSKSGKSWEELARVETQKPQPAPQKALEEPQTVTAVRLPPLRPRI
jgi:hypothetical protein